MEIEIREANISDIENGLLKVFIQGYRYHQKGRPDIYEDLSDENLKQDLIKNFEDLSIIVLILNNKIEGYLSYKIKERHAKKLDVDQLVVAEESRNKGFGKMLIEEVKNIAKKNNCQRIELNCWLFNENALAMYDHLGFEKQRIIYEMKTI